MNNEQQSGFVFDSDLQSDEEKGSYFETGDCGHPSTSLHRCDDSSSGDAESSPHIVSVDSVQRARNWVFTINNPSPSCSDSLLELVPGRARYIIFGNERAPSTGTRHFQGFVVFQHAKTRSAVSKIIPQAWLQAAKGDGASNIAYCSKGGDYVSRGVPPVSKKAQGESEKERWANALEDAKNGDLDDIPADIMLRFYGTIKRIETDYMKAPADLDDVCGIWIWGVAGVGKSRLARAQFPGAYFKMCNKWWDGYQHEKFVIMDDLDPKHEVLGHHIKIWSDRYGFIAERKGGALFIRPRKFIITSQYAPDDVFTDCATLQAIRRRFKVILLPEGFSPEDAERIHF